MTEFVSEHPAAGVTALSPRVCRVFRTSLRGTVSTSSLTNGNEGLCRAPAF